jgi:hypothetical protein
MPQPFPQSATHLVPQTFDLRPSQRSSYAANQLRGYPDELMIDWGSTPLGTRVQVFWPQASSSDVVRLAMLLYSTTAPTAVDLHTVEVVVGERVAFIPIPFGTAGHLAGLFTLQLPSGIAPGREFQIVVRRLSTRQPPASPVIAGRRRSTSVSNTSAGRSEVTRDWRYVVGTFQITIPVRPKENLLIPEERTLSIMKWRLLQTPLVNRWYPVLKRYVSYLSGRVDGFGGNAGGIVPSPIGQLPAPIVSKHCEDTMVCSGKVCEVMFDCFGDFEGFVLATCAESIRFHSRERGVAELVLRACRERLSLSVSLERGRPGKICRLIVHC